MHSLEDMLCKDTASLFSVSLSLSLSCLGFRGHGQPLARRPTAQGARSPGSVLPLVGDCASCAQNPFKPKPNPLTVTARPWTALGSSAAHVRIGRTGYMSEPSSHYLQHQRRSVFLSLSLSISPSFARAAPGELPLAARMCTPDFCGCQRRKSASTAYLGVPRRSKRN